MTADPPVCSPGSPASDATETGGVDSNSVAERFLVVAIGASAGGLDAFTQLLRHLPPDTGMVFVLIQHLAPDHVSSLSEILTRTTQMPVHEVQDGMAVAPNCVYVIPPNTLMTIAAGVLKLEPRQRIKGKPMPIDGFFSALATERGSQAIAIVLSGSDEDGTLGLATVKAAGGITFAQTPQSSEFGIMPQRAIASGSVDFVLPPAEIAAELVNISRHPYLRFQPKAEPSATEGEALSGIFTLLRTTMGVDFTYYKQGTLRRRIMRRMVLHHLERLEDYVEFLQTNPAEVENLYQDVLIRVTSFFREPGSFEALKQSVFPSIIQHKSLDASIRIWVTACATGEEAYSIAISLLEFLDNHSPLIQIQIFATDISEAAIAQARIGIYPQPLLANVSPERLRRWFVPVDGGYQIGKQVRELCVFARQDITRDPPFSQLDLISCRNVLIYLEPALQKKVMPIFHYALKPTGFLMLGSSESIGDAADLFIVADKKHRIYARKPALTSLNFNFAPSNASRLPTVSEPAGQNPVWGDHDLEQAADQIVLKQYAPVGVVINAELEIVQFRGQTSLYLEPTPGKASLNLLKMVRSSLALELRAAIHQASQQNAPVCQTELRMQVGEQWHSVNLHVIPFAQTAATPDTAGEEATPDNKLCYFLVLFDSRLIAALPATATESTPPRKSRKVRQTEAEQEIARLTQELATTKEYLQSIIHSQEASNQDLKVANEEILSSNEELQSTNEELETAKEEIQATNEELSTTNEELRSRNLLLNQVNNDLKNLLSSVNIPILMVSGDLRIRRFTPMAEQLFNLIPTDVGRPLSNIQPNINAPQLVSLIATVIDTLNTYEQEVQDQTGHWYSLRIRPYKTIENQIDGAVIGLIDIDALKRNALLLEASRNHAAAIVAAVREPLLVLNASLAVITANQAFYQTFQLVPAQTEQQVFFELGQGMWNHPYLRSQLVRMLSDQTTLQDFEIDQEITGLGQRTLLLNASPITHDGMEPMILVEIADITVRRQAERLMADDYHQKLQQQVQEMERLSLLKDDFLSTVSHELRSPMTTIRMAIQMLEVGLKNPHVSETLMVQLKHYVQILNQECRRETNLINDLLDLSQLDAGVNVLELTTIDLQTWIPVIVEPFASTIQSHQQQLQLQIPADLPTLTTHRNYLERIVSELLQNACKYTPAEGVITVSASVKPAENTEKVNLETQTALPHLPPPSLRLQVSNSGVEIPAAELTHIFEKFYRMPTHNPWEQGGTGLGLALVQRMVERLQGTITAQSTEGQTHLIVLLPFNLAEVEPFDGVVNLG